MDKLLTYWYGWRKSDHGQFLDGDHLVNFTGGFYHLEVINMAVTWMAAEMLEAAK